jgi:hypothetical protein
LTLLPLKFPQDFNMASGRSQKVAVADPTEEEEVRWSTFRNFNFRILELSPGLYMVSLLFNIIRKLFTLILVFVNQISMRLRSKMTLQQF